MAEIQGRIRLLEAKGLGLREGSEEGGITEKRET